MKKQDASDVAERYAAGVGQRLRSVRMSAGLSLRGASARSGGMFSPALLGAYERYERGISMARLQQLAELYDVRLDALLPMDPNIAPTSQRQRSRSRSQRSHSAQTKTMIDLTKLHLAPNPQRQALGSFVTAIRDQREAAHPAIVVIRTEDARIITLLFKTPEAGAAILDALRPDEI